MQAIQTKVIPATNFRPTRIKAWCQRGSITLDINGLDVDGLEDRHIRVVEILCHNFAIEDIAKYKTPYITNPWKSEFITGALPNGDFAHVFIE